MAEVGFLEGIARELGGPGRFRLFVQPAVAVILGVRLGVADAKEGKAPFLLRLLKTSQRPWALLKGSLWDVVVPLTLALGMDAFLQYFALGFVRPLAAVVVATLLVWIPFALSRATTNRLWSRRHRHAEGANADAAAT